MNQPSPGALYLVATPIGNLGDISSRAAQTLRDVDFIAAEDTRVSRKLLEYLKMKKPLVSYHEHNRHASGEDIIGRILSGESCALITDAGTPAISDPGEELVNLCIERGVRTLAIPGPCAAITALAASGLSTGRFTFEGFLSTARKSRFEHLNELKHEKRTMVFYEAPHKLVRTLDDMLSVFGDRRISISRELTKIYEETLRLSLSEAAERFKQVPPRGEFVLVVEGAACKPAAPQCALQEAILAAEGYINDGMSVKDAVKRTAEECSVPRNMLYKEIINS